MVDIIKKILEDNKNINDYILLEEVTESEELFAVKDKIDMCRNKKVHNFNVTVFVDFEEDGVKYKGSSNTVLHPSMSKDELKETINSAAFAAGFVKNKYYPLPEAVNVHSTAESTSFKKDNLKDGVKKIYDSIYLSDAEGDNGINSSEIFLNKINKRILSSKGTDSTHEFFAGKAEVISSWTDNDNAVETFLNVDFGDFNKEKFEDTIEKTVDQTRAKTKALPTPNLGKSPVILGGEVVAQILQAYALKSSAMAIHSKFSDWKIGDNVQGEDVEGDLLTLELDPELKNSTKATPFDQDGVALKKHTIIKDGILQTYHGNIMYSHYLGIEPTGEIRTARIKPGSLSEMEMKSEPYVEILEFSAFNIDFITLNFGGEIRLARYYDGEMISYITGGALVGNLLEGQKKMYFSKELQETNDIHGPKYIKMHGLNISGK